MPSRQHESVKNILNKAVQPLKDKGRIPEIHHMRHLLELGTFFYLLPWGVHHKQIKIKIKGSMFTQINADLLVPSDADKEKVLLYFHGGGYTIGSVNSHRSLVGKIAKKAGIIALLPDYRKAPENPFPAALEDAYSCYCSLLDRGKAPENIIFAGDSAGGGLAFSLALKLKDLGEPLPGAIIGLSPWVDLTGSGESVIKNADKDPLIDLQKMRYWASMYASHENLESPYVSALYGNFENFPPSLIQVSKDEMLYDDGLRLYEKINRQSHNAHIQTWDGLIHWWHLFQKLIPEANEAVELIVDFIKEIYQKKSML
jgi:acetyl esterase/lipase